jgi:hypothetical protein
MFKVKINVLVKIQGCPDDGLAAVTFRRKHGLPEQPNNLANFEYESGSDEAFCQQFPELLNANADLILETFKDYSSQHSIRYVPVLGNTLGDVVCPVEIMQGHYDTTRDQVEALVHTVLFQKMCISDDKAAAEAKREADRVTRVETEKDTQMRKYADEIIEREKRDSWIAAHGSNRLKRLVAEGIRCEGVYRDERLAHDRPGWTWYDSCDGLSSEAINPPIEALGTLDKAREFEPEAKLFFHQADNGDLWSGYTAEAWFMDKWITFGLPEEY